jgi:transcriptional regulator with XRE-family HTH domain
MAMTGIEKLDIRRERLGMSRAALARKSGVSIAAVHRILSGKEDSPSVATLDALASVLGLAIEVVEVADAEELREQQAKRKAERITSMVQGTMALEAQAVARKNLDRITKRNIHRLLAGPDRKLWDE